MSQRIPRRRFLRGLGTAMALPLLEGLSASRALGAASAAKAVEPPVRMAFLYVPNGVHMPAWKPATEGAGYELTPILQPLAPVKAKLSVLSGLTQDKARANGDGPGDHARSAAAVLTSSQPYKTNGADIHVGVSVDQVAAKQVGKATMFPSLELGIDRSAQAGNCDSGYSCAYSSNIAWASPTTPLAKEVNPRLVFERLFRNGEPVEIDARQAKQNKYRKSILDFVMEDAKTLDKQLGVRDRAKLDEYFTSIEEIEQRLLRYELGDAAAVPGAERPAGIPGVFGEHVDLMADMLLLAFQTDQTRISTFMFANEGSNRSYPEIDVADGHHNISHHQGDPEKQAKIQRINTLHIAKLSAFLQKMDQVQESDGSSLLDNSMVVYCSAISDGNRHNHDDLPVLLAGGAKGVLQQGRHVVYDKNTPMANLYLAMLDVMGVKLDSFGDSTGYLNGLTA